ncbi:cold sensitive U2 snRNA suppressor 1 [Monosporozyma servazzii]
MARKSKKSSQGKQPVKKPSIETNVANLIENRRKQEELKKKVVQTLNNNKKKKKLTQPLKPVNSTVLLEQFNDVLQKFEAPKHVNPSPKRAHRDENAQLPEKEVVDNHEETPAQPSKRKLRKLNKPSLIDLKSQVTHPEIIEWYDCDAPYPFLNATIKSTKNVVRVPSHWQTKREYLSGRSLLNKKPFELPDIMKQTDIETMRSVLPGEEPVEEESIKGMSRARIQPKLGALDIDFKKLYDIFFKLGSTWKPDVLLPFGDLYFENRNLHEESEWRKIKRSMRPGKISKNLRDIMGLEDGQLPPWCHKMNKLGMPPSYPNMKIAGLNWDIQFMKDDIYGKVPKSNDKKNKKNVYFGQILNFEEDDSSDDEEEDTKGDIPIAEITNPNDNKVSISEVEVPVDDIKPDQKITDDEVERPLYKVLKESTNETAVGQTKLYSMPGHTTDQENAKSQGNSTEEDQENDEQQIEDGEEDELKNFKF